MGEATTFGEGGIHEALKDLPRVDLVKAAVMESPLTPGLFGNNGSSLGVTGRQEPAREFEQVEPSVNLEQGDYVEDVRGRGHGFSRGRGQAARVGVTGTGNRVAHGDRLHLSREWVSKPVAIATPKRSKVGGE